MVDCDIPVTLKSDIRNQDVFGNLSVSFLRKVPYADYVMRSRV